jgi:hypothetical protein
MTIAALTLLALLFLKHFVWDFCCQTPEMLRGKGIYGNKDGIFHSYLQAIFTWAAVFAVGYPRPVSPADYRYSA